MRTNRLRAKFILLMSSAAMAAWGQTQGTCSGPDIEKGNWNLSTVKGGGRAPSIDLGPETYCVVFVATYHYNGGRGDTPGTITLNAGGRSLGPFSPVVESAVNWVYYPPANAPLLLTGRVTVIDSKPGTWSNNEAADFVLPTTPHSSGFGFAKFILRAYTPPGGSGGGTSPPGTCPALTWKTVTVPEGNMLSGYQNPVEPSGGVPPYRFSLDERVTPLPRGMVFDRESGLLAGVPLERGDFPLRITVTDSCRQPQSVSRDFLLRIRGPAGIEIFGPDRITVESGKEASAVYVVSGGDNATRVLSVTAPPEIRARVEGNRTLFVTGNTPGIYRVTLRATDGVSPPGEKTVTVEVSPPPLGFRTASPLPEGSLYAAYVPAVQMEASGGCPPYSFSVIGPTPLNQAAQPLPGGLTLTPVGLLSGIPLEAVTRTVKISVTDRCGGTVVKDFLISVTPARPLQISGAASIILEAGKTKSEAYTVTGGNPSRYSLTVNAPPGVQTTVARAESIWNLGLTASSPGNQTVTMTITDGSSVAVEKKVDLRVAEPFSWVVTSNPDNGRSCAGFPVVELGITAMNGVGGKNFSVSPGFFLGIPAIAVNGGPPELRGSVSFQAGPGVRNSITVTGLSVRAEGVAELTGDITGFLRADPMPKQFCGGEFRLPVRGNTFQARLTSSAGLIFQGVPFDPPSSASRLIRLLGMPPAQTRSFFRFSNVPEGVRMWVHAPPEVSREGDGCRGESPLGGSAHLVSGICANEFRVNQQELDKGRMAFQAVIDPIESVLRASIEITTGFQVSQGQIIRSIEERRFRLAFPRIFNVGPDPTGNSLAPVSPGSRAIIGFPPTDPPIPPGAGRSPRAAEEAPYLDDAAGVRHAIDILRNSEPGATVILIPEKAAPGRAFLTFPRISSVAQEIEIVDSAPSLYEEESADGTQLFASGSAAPEDSSVSYAPHALSQDRVLIPVELSRLPPGARMLVTLDGTGFRRGVPRPLVVLVANRPVPLISIEPNPDEPGKERITFALPARGIPAGKVSVDLIDGENPLNPVLIEIR